MGFHPFRRDTTDFRPDLYALRCLQPHNKVLFRHDMPRHLWLSLTLTVIVSNRSSSWHTKSLLETSFTVARHRLFMPSRHLRSRSCSAMATSGRHSHLGHPHSARRQTDLI